MSETTHAELTHRLSHDFGSLSGWIKRPDADDCSTGDVPFLVPKCVSSRGFEQKEHRKLSSLSIGSAHAF